MNDPALTRQQAREVDRIAAERFGLSGLVLMENAGLLATLELCAGGVPPGPVAVLCGGGNNGGDGFVIARQLAIRGVEVVVQVVKDSAAQGGDAGVNRAVVEAMGLSVLDIRSATALEGAIDIWQACSLRIDALLGTGFQGELRAPLARIIEGWNLVQGGQVVAIDLPSGLDADTGRPAAATVRAQRTLTFVAPKVGFAAPGAAAYTGKVTVLPIGAPRAALDAALELEAEG
jgi:NAD(P)H-hydrate epimerase